MKLRFLFLMTLYIPILLFSQNDTSYKGIKWTTGLSWEQVKEKAKAENKCIFLDVFATWCKPCKVMDMDVYVNDTVGTYFDDKFISVKIQTDQTKRDDEFIKNWYKDAAAISNKYRVVVLPTYLFFNSSGEMVHKETGFKNVNDFLTEAKIATMPGKKYVNPYGDYDKLVDNYNKGKRDYNKFIYMVKIAHNIRDYPFEKELSMQYIKYLEGLKESRLYTKDNLSFLKSNLSNSKSKLFSLFYPSGERVDAIMQQTGYSRFIVERIIKAENITSAIDSFSSKNTTKAILTGAEPDWQAISKAIAEKYDLGYAERTVRAERRMFYWSTRNSPEFIEQFIIQYQKHELDTTDDYTDIWLNTLVWEIFLTSNDREQIRIGLEAVTEVIRRNVFGDNSDKPLDTYANLLYKESLLFNTGKESEAVTWEKKALDLAIKREDIRSIKNIQEIIDIMKSGKPTWQ